MATLIQLTLVFAFLTRDGGEEEEEDGDLFSLASLKPKTTKEKQHQQDDDVDDDEEESLKQFALSMLDCLTSPQDTDDPEYNFEKDSRRDQLLSSTNYSELKVELRARGLKTSGDKVEMITRLLLHIVDPSIQYEDEVGVKVKYVDPEQVKAKEYIEHTPEERLQIQNLPPDSDDLRLLPRKGRKAVRRLVMDGLDRRIATYLPLYCQRSKNKALEEDMVTNGDNSLRAYLTSSSLLLRGTMDMSKSLSAIIVLPPRSLGWGSKEMRVLADEWAFQTQSIVLMPDLYRKVGSSNTQSVDGVKVTHSNEIDQEHDEYKRAFDDVVACMLYAKQKWSAQAVSVVGVGNGADWALEIASDLHSFACQAVVEESRKTSKTLGEVVKVHNLYRRRSPRVLDLRGDSKNSKQVEDQLMKSLFGTTNRTEVLSTEDRQRFDEELQKLLQSMDDDKGEMMMMEEVVGDNDNNDPLSRLMPSVLNEDEDDKIPEDPSLPVDMTSQQYTKDCLRIEELANNVMIEGKLFPRASVSLTDILTIQPRAVTALLPKKLDLTDIQHRLSTSLLLVTTTTNKVVLENASLLKKALDKRSDELLDYSFRIYEDFSEDFVYNPQNEMDTKAVQDVLDLASLWTDALTQADDAELVDGAGTVKTRGEGWWEVQKEDLWLPVRASAVAAYLHDEPDFLPK
eukprot:scaffold323_cov181-Ochromonas_danica.AAC.17